MSDPLGPVLSTVGHVLTDTGQIAHVVTDAATGAVGAVGGTLTAVGTPAPSGSVVAPVEPGASTSEFKVAIGALAGILAVFGITLSQHTQDVLGAAVSAAMALIASVYAIVRTMRKNTMR